MIKYRKKQLISIYFLSSIFLICNQTPALSNLKNNQFSNSNFYHKKSKSLISFLKDNLKLKKKNIEFFKLSKEDSFKFSKLFATLLLDKQNNPKDNFSLDIESNTQTSEGNIFTAEGNVIIYIDNGIFKSFLNIFFYRFD